jgi:hypothetical protein
MLYTLTILLASSIREPLKLFANLRDRFPQLVKQLYEKLDHIKVWLPNKVKLHILAKHNRLKVNHQRRVFATQQTTH